MNQAVEQYPGQIKDLEAHIARLEKLVEQLNTRIRDLESQVYGGSSK